jgi:hypothetical protein
MRGLGLTGAGRPQGAGRRFIRPVRDLIPLLANFKHHQAYLALVLDMDRNRVDKGLVSDLGTTDSAKPSGQAR